MPYDRSAFITRTPIEGVAFDFAQDETGFLADKIFTPKPVVKAETKVYQMDTSKLRLMNSKKATNSESDAIDEQMFATSVTLEEHKLKSKINPRDERDADMPVLLGDARKAKLVTQALLIAREKLAFTAVTTTANYPAALTSAIASGSRWNETNGDAEADMVTANTALRNKCGRRANALAIGDVTLDKLRLSPQFRTRTQYTNAGPVPDALIKAYFGVDYLHVGTARFDSAQEGITAAIDGFWSDYALAYVYDPSSSLEDCSFGHMYLMKAPFWSKIINYDKLNGAAGSMRAVEIGTEYKLSPGYVMSSTDTDFAAGYLFRTVVA